MRLDISEALREVGGQESYDIEEPPLVDEDIECVRPIEGRITFTNAGNTLLLRGKASTAVALPCSRCARYFEQPIALEVEEQFELRRLVAGPRVLPSIAIIEEDENPVAGTLFEGQVFNLTELLRQYILLDEPMQPLPPLKEDGRCAHCGLAPAEALQALTETPEASEPEAEPPINPAFSKLNQLLDKE